MAAMERDNTTGNTPVNPAAAGALASSARRRLLRGGLSAAPVVLTLASRPVLATTCVTASAMASANASRPAGNSVTCAGMNAQYWCGSFTGWPSLMPKTTTFNACIGPSLFKDTTTCLDVLKGKHEYGSTSTYSAAQLEFAKNCVLAMVNLADNKIGTDVLSVTQIKRAWLDAPSGNFAADAASGIRWDTNKVNLWFTQMWG